MTDKQYTVTLKRGPKPDVIYGPVNRRYAESKARALANLHTTTIERDSNGNYIIDAAFWYSDAKA